MKLLEKKLFVVNFTAEELDALELADRALGELYNVFGRDDKLVSPDTGELVELNELPRVRGILNLLCTRRTFELD
jgi:hypothetical protein